jgi:hypothetical protein
MVCAEPTALFSLCNFIQRVKPLATIWVGATPLNAIAAVG